MSEFDDEAGGLNDKEFEENLKHFEEMLATGQAHFFDTDDLEEIIDYYLQWVNYEMAK